MDIAALYSLVDPQLAQALKPDTIPFGGQLFIREVGTEGLCIAVGILAPLPKQFKTEHIYPAKVDLHYKQGEDRTEEARGMGINGVLTSPWWRVRAPGPRG